MAQYQFGSGILYGSSNGGNQVVNPTPQKFGVLQSVSIDIEATIKELKGMLQVADDIAVSDLKITGKASFGRISGSLYNNLFFGSLNQTPGVKQMAGPGGNGEPAIVPAASGPYIVVVANSVGFIADYGVSYAASGTGLTRVTSNPTVGQYTVSAGTYTFAAADAGAAVVIGYLYSNTLGITTVIQNNVRGYSPSFELMLATGYNFAGGGWRLFSCKANKLSMPTKMDDYQITEIDFQAFATPSGLIGELYTQS